MISIVICSINPDYLQRLKENIADTIGVPHEVIVIDNRGRRSGICEAYNEGAMYANFPVICFMHEDILFETSNWGLLALAHLAHPSCAMIGIAGGDAKSLVPSSWSVPMRSNHINLVQHARDQRGGGRRILETDGEPGTRKKVVAIDGVWMCVRREIVLELSFDRVHFPAFHGYDIDFSLQVSTRYEVYVALDIVLHHFSEGNPDRNWMRAAMDLSHKWRGCLPVAAVEADFNDYRTHHWRSMQVFLKRLRGLGFGYPYIVGQWLGYSFNRFFTLRRFLSAGKYILTGMK